MKTYRFKHITATSFTALALCLGPVSVMRAQNQPTQTQAQLEAMTPQTEAFTLAKIAGRPLRGGNQEQFSTIEDFLIEPQSGRVHFALSPSGSNTFRIIPMSAIDLVGNNAEALALRLDRGQWNRVGTMTEQELQGRISVDEAHQRRLTDQFSLGHTEAAIGGLVRASTLKGREMRAGNDHLGTVEDVVIDFHNKIAAPVLKASVRFAGTEQKFLVPFTRLQLSDGHAPIITTLNRNDFRQMYWQSSPTPTGHPSVQGGQLRQTFQPTAQAAIAIQQSLDQNQAIPRGSVQVVPESRIVLRGMVSSPQQKAQIEQQAQQSAPGVRVDSEIQVRNW